MPESLPTMQDVADRAGVSRQLVSLVLRGAAGPSEQSRERVLQAAEALGFRANTSAQRLRQTRTSLIGASFAASNPFEAKVVELLLERAPAHGFGVVLAPTTAARTTDVVVDELLGHRVEALACFNPDPASRALDRALDLVPVVWLGERSAEPRADVVRTDDDEGLRLLVAHLVGLGHTEIAYVGGLGAGAGPDRAETYRAAMRGAGLGEHIDVVEAGFDAEDGAGAARRLLARAALPTAVVAGSDTAAAAVRTVLALAGVDVPGRVSIAGYDDSDLAALSFTDLTSVRQDAGRTVDAVLAAILRRLEDPSAPPRDTPTLATLTVRSSTGPARDA